MAKAVFDKRLEFRVIHKLCKDAFVLFHPVNKETLKYFTKDQMKSFVRIGTSNLPQVFIRNSFFSRLVKEQLVCRLEVRSKPFIYNIDKLG